MKKLISRNPVQRFKQGKKIIFAQKGTSFKEAWNEARAKKQRYFNWTDNKGVTRMYNSKATGNDVDYESFIDNMNEMSALLPTDNSPKHLGWERNNPTSTEIRGNDRIMGNKIGGTENTIKEPIITGSLSKSKNKKTVKPKSKVQYNVVYNVPMGAIEYTGRDGKKYWMRQNHSTGEYYYIDRNQPISYAKNIVPEGYIIPGANIKINKGTNIGKLALSLQKQWLKQGGVLPSRNPITRFRNRKSN